MSIRCSKCEMCTGCGSPCPGCEAEKFENLERTVKEVVKLCEKSKNDGGALARATVILVGLKLAEALKGGPDNEERG